MRIEAALAPLLVLHGIVHHGAITRANTADGTQTLLAAEQLLADLQALLAVLVANELRRLIAEFWVHVVFPERQRLQNVSVGIDDVVRAVHDSSPVRWNSRQRLVMRPCGRRLISS